MKYYVFLPKDFYLFEHQTPYVANQNPKIPLKYVTVNAK